MNRFFILWVCLSAYKLYNPWDATKQADHSQICHTNTYMYMRSWWIPLFLSSLLAFICRYNAVVKTWIMKFQNTTKRTHQTRTMVQLEGPKKKLPFEKKKGFCQFIYYLVNKFCCTIEFYNANVVNGFWQLMANPKQIKKKTY